MSEWKCPIDSLDSDIREVVRVLYENNMRPYMSCSGSYRDHRNKGFIPECAGIEILDSELTRELIAVLISDKRFKCSIAKERGRVLYDMLIVVCKMNYVKLYNQLFKVEELKKEIEKR